MDITKEYVKMCEKAFKDLGTPDFGELGILYAIEVKDGRKKVYLRTHFLVSLVKMNDINLLATFHFTTKTSCRGW